MSNKYTIHNKIDKSKKEYDFAFLVHPRNIQDIYKEFPFLKIVPVVLFMFFFKKISPVILSTVNGVVDEKGKKIKGVIISLPITAEQMLRDRNLAKKQVFRAIKKAKKLGATYVGLGSFTSVVTSGGQDVCGLIEGVHVTNGNALTASMTYLGIQDLIRNSTVREPNIAIIGATGSIGSAVTELLTKDGSFGTLYIVGRTPSHIQKLLQRITPHPHSHRVMETNMEEALPKVDIVVTATSASGTVIRAELLKKDAIVYDITQPKNTPQDLLTKRPDVTFIDGGLIKLPEHIHVGYNFGIPTNTSFSCLAETILLSLAHYPDDFCVGNVTLEQVKYAETLANRYKFSPIRHT